MARNCRHEARGGSAFACQTFGKDYSVSQDDEGIWGVSIVHCKLLKAWSRLAQGNMGRGVGGRGGLACACMEETGETRGGGWKGGGGAPASHSSLSKIIPSFKSTIIAIIHSNMVQILLRTTIFLNGSVFMLI